MQRFSSTLPAPCMFFIVQTAIKSACKSATVPGSVHGNVCNLVLCCLGILLLVLFKSGTVVLCDDPLMESAYKYCGVAMCRAAMLIISSSLQCHGAAVMPTCTQ